MDALVLKNVRFGYDDFLLFEDLDLSFSAVRLTGVVGQNGAGKSTLCDILAGVYEAEVERCEWFGGDFGLSELRHKVAYASQEPEFFPALTGLENIELLGSLLEQPEDYVARVSDLTQRLGLKSAELAGKQVGRYSGGMRAKLWVAAHLATDREFLILDEPFESLDRESEAVLVGVLNQDRRPGVLVSHDMPEQLHLAGVLELVGQEDGS